MKTSDFLAEMDWHERTPLTPVLDENRGRWVHFSQIAKLGINPKSTWRDPKGIYFYPVDWLLDSDFERLKRGDQFATNYPYYFFVDLDMTGDGVVTSKATWGDVEKIADRNGWRKYLDEYRQDPTQFDLKLYAKPDLPGGFLWHFVECLVEKRIITWNAALKGLDYIYDDNQVVMNHNEPHQIVVFNPRIIKNVKMGDQNRDVRNHRDEWERWGHGLTKMFEQVAARYDGQVTWAQKRPQVEFAVGDRSFKITIGRDLRIGVNYRYGRATGYYGIKPEIWRNGGAKAFLVELEKIVQGVSAFKTDLSFEPVISIEDAKAFIETSITEAPLDWTVEIKNNDELLGQKVSFGNDVRVEGVARLKDRMNVLDLNVAMFLYDDHVTTRITVYVDGASVVNVMADGDVTSVLPKLLKQMRERVDYFDQNTMGPRAEWSWRFAKFFNQNEFDAFVGWVLVTAGLAKMAGETFSKEITAYHGNKNKGALSKETYRVLSTFSEGKRR